MAPVLPVLILLSFRWAILMPLIDVAPLVIPTALVILVFLISLVALLLLLLLLLLLPLALFLLRLLLGMFLLGHLWLFILSLREGTL